MRNRKGLVLNGHMAFLLSIFVYKQARSCAHNENALDAQHPGPTSLDDLEVERLEYGQRVEAKDQRGRCSNGQNIMISMTVDNFLFK